MAAHVWKPHQSCQIECVHASHVNDAIADQVEVLSGLQHDRIVCLLGACLAPPTICIVEELALGGSLYDSLHTRSGSRGCKPMPEIQVSPRLVNSQSVPELLCSLTQRMLDLCWLQKVLTIVMFAACSSQLLRVAIDVADALRYMHHFSQPQILHRCVHINCAESFSPSLSAARLPWTPGSVFSGVQGSEIVQRPPGQLRES